MHFFINRESLLYPLQYVATVIEKKQTLPILSNVLIMVTEKKVEMVGSDLEIELVGKTEPTEVKTEGRTTLPARKLMDICRTLPENSQIELFEEEGRAHIKSGRSHYQLSTLPAKDYPNMEDEKETNNIEIKKTSLRELIEKTGFSMAQQDVRYFLNGMLLETKNSKIKAVATDGHRLATSTTEIKNEDDQEKQYIVPRKSILTLAKLTAGGYGENTVKIKLGKKHISAQSDSLRFTSKLLDGKYPDYERAIPRGGKKILEVERESLKEALTRAAILSNERLKGVKFSLKKDLLVVTANNPSQEQATEELAVFYGDEEIEISFNVLYLLNVLTVFTSEKVLFKLSNSTTGVLIEEPDNKKNVYVIMPIHL